jgi:tRNA (mo5U34)-methyltransferase
MKTYQRLCFALAQEGATNLLRRRLLRPGKSRNGSVQQKNKALEEHDEVVRNFNEATRSLGFANLENFYWYHTIDLGSGIVTPGDYDYRSSLSAFQFPDDLRGMSVLDIGSATGFFAFEFERRGADVVSVELPSIAQWDMPLHERDRTIQGLLNWHRTQSVEELHYRHLDGPFEFCKKMLNSKVERRHSTIYDVSAEKLGKDSFDLVFLGDILLHTFSPFKALVSVAPLCRKTLIIAQDIPTDLGEKPLMLFLGGAGDQRSWWLANLTCLEQMLRRLGFGTISVVGQYSGIVRRGGFSYHRTVVHATKNGAEAA